MILRRRPVRSPQSEQLVCETVSLATAPVTLTCILAKKCLPQFDPESCTPFVCSPRFMGIELPKRMNPRVFAFSTARIRLVSRARKGCGCRRVTTLTFRSPAHWN
jgi:hypothetical protein